jgi:hypothetical protein
MRWLLIPAAFFGAVLIDHQHPILGFCIAIVAFIIACLDWEKHDFDS